jgi:outer membrane protein
MRSPWIVVAFAALALPAADAIAQDYRVRLGLGAQVTPEFPGADSSEVTPFPSVDVAKGDKPFGFDAPDDSFDIALVSRGGFRAGPVANLGSNRPDSEVGAPVGDVPTTFEAGVFAQQMLGESFRLRGEVRRGIGGHDGFIGNVGADYIARDGDKYAFSIGPRLVLSDSRYQRAYFGVSPDVSIQAALPVYRPDGGIQAVALVSGFNYALSDRWGLFGYGRYDRLLGDARDSPIVREFGSPNQFSAGLGLSHTFTIRL